MQLQTKPKYYADFNKHMDEAYYNYEAYDIEYGYAEYEVEISIGTKLSPKLGRGSIQRCIWVLPLLTIRMLSLRLE